MGNGVGIFRGDIYARSTAPVNSRYVRTVAYVSRNLYLKQNQRLKQYGPLRLLRSSGVVYRGLNWQSESVCGSYRGRTYTMCYIAPVCENTTGCVWCNGKGLHSL